MEGLQAGVPGAVRVRVSPGMVERRLGRAPESVVERCLAFRSLPGVVLQWTGPGPEGAPARGSRLSLAWRTPLSGAVPAPDAPGDGTPLLEIPTPGSGRIAFALLPAPERWRLEVTGKGPDRALRIGVRVPAGSGPVTLVVAGDPAEPGAAATVLRRLEHLDAEVRAWSAPSGGRGPNALELSTPDGLDGRALAWADVRLRSLTPPDGASARIRPPTGFGRACPDDARWIWAGHGLLAAGRFAGARRLLAWGAGRLPPPRSRSGGGSDAADPASALYVHLAARYLRWSGAPALPDPAHRAVSALEERLLDAASGVPPRSRAAAATVAALTELAEARDEPGRPPGGDALRDAAEALERRIEGADDSTGRTPGRSLPVLGVGAPPPSAGADPDGPVPSVEILAALLGVAAPPASRSPPAADAPGGLALGLRAWAAWRTGDPERAGRLWRRHLRSGVRGQRGLWPPMGRTDTDPSACVLDVGAVGAAVAPLVFGFLGARADAAFGRLRLAPRIPGAWEAFEVRGVRMADVRVRLRYRRQESRHTFVVTPAAGRVPPNLVFEPLLPLRKIGGVRVDGEPADLDRYRTGPWTGVRLQLPLDSTREVIVDGDEHV